MSPEHKQQDMDLLEQWRNTGNEWEEAEVGHEMATLLRELIDAEQAAGLPDEQLQAAFDRGLKAGNEQAIAQQIEIHKLHDLLAARQPEQPADLVRDAERYRWLRNDGAGFDISVAEIDDDGHESWVHGYPPEELDAAIDAAIERDEMKGGA